MVSGLESAKHTQIVKQTILRSFAVNEENFSKFYCREEGKALLEKIKKSEGTSAYIFRKRELVNNLNDSGVVCSMADNFNELTEKVNMLPAGEEMDRPLFDILYKVYSLAMSPASQIEKLVRNLGEPKFQSGSVRLAILKQFIKNTTYHTSAVIDLILEHEKQFGTYVQNNLSAEEYALLADEYLFDVISDKLSKTDKRKYHLLRVCDDLATGRFKSNGNTKIALYMFAFAFDMTVFVDPEKDVYDEEKDLEKNLFMDYYSNSLLRFISEDYKSHFRDYEAEPLGDGINYKNFVEVIYLYYLSRKDIPVATRMNLAEKKIAECVEYVSKGKSITEQNDIKLLGTENRYTYIYKELFIYILSNLSEDELVPFVCNNYMIDVDNNSKARIVDASETNTAAFYYFRGIDLSEQKYVDVKGEKQYADKVCGHEDDFLALVKKMMDILFLPAEKTEKRITRTDILRMYYYRALTDESLESASLMDIFDNMRIRCNEILRTSRYQEISEKNIFDVFVLIMLYRNINLV